MWCYLTEQGKWRACSPWLAACVVMGGGSVRLADMNKESNS